VLSLFHQSRSEPSRQIPTAIDAIIAPEEVLLLQYIYCETEIYDNVGNRGGLWAMPRILTFFGSLIGRAIDNIPLRYAMLAFAEVFLPSNPCLRWHDYYRKACADLQIGTDRKDPRECLAAYLLLLISIYKTDVLEFESVYDLRLYIKNLNRVEANSSGVESELWSLLRPILALRTSQCLVIGKVYPITPNLDQWDESSYCPNLVDYIRTYEQMLRGPAMKPPTKILQVLDYYEMTFHRLLYLLWRPFKSDLNGNEVEVDRDVKLLQIIQKMRKTLLQNSVYLEQEFIPSLVVCRSAQLFSFLAIFALELTFIVEEGDLKYQDSNEWRALERLMLDRCLTIDHCGTGFRFGLGERLLTLALGYVGLRGSYFLDGSIEPRWWLIQ